MQLILGLTLAFGLVLSACQTAQPKGENSCMVLVILPPENIDEVASDYVAKKWIEEVKRSNLLEKCDKILHPKKLRDIFVALNISNQKNLEASNLLIAQRKYLQEHAEATHVASLKYRYSREKLYIDASLYSLTQEASLAKHPLLQTMKLKDVDPSLFASDSGKRFRLFLLQLVPTAISFGYANSEFPNSYSEAGAKQRYVEMDKVKRSALPPFLGSIRVENIPARSGFNSFDGTLRVLPYLNITSVDNLYTYATADEYYSKLGDRSVINTFQYGLLFYGVTPNLIIEGAFYTPIGTWFIGLGAGPTFTYLSDTAGNTSYELKFSLLSRAGYRAFFNERWYFQVMTETQNYTGQVNSEYFKATKEQYNVFSIGYLFPELQRKFRESIF